MVGEEMCILLYTNKAIMLHTRPGMLDADPPLAEMRDAIAYQGAAGTLLVTPLVHPRSERSRERSRDAMVVSVSLFIFPGRANGNADDYLERVDSYMRGIDLCLAKLSGTAWVYRIYVDHSVLREYARDSGAAAAAALVQHRLADIANKTPASRLDLSAVRFLRAAGGALRPTAAELDDTTFLPSIWRFLPMADPTVGIFCSADADNPVSTLMLQLGERWLQEEASHALFFKLKTTFSPQCALYVATHLSGSTPQDSMCPIAQFWFWRRIREDAADGAALFARLMDLAADADVHAFFAGLGIEWVHGGLHRAVLADPRFVALAARTRHPERLQEDRQLLLTTVKTVLLHVLSQVQQQGSDPDPDHREWARLVSLNPQPIDLAMLLVCGRTVSDALGPNLKQLL